MAAYVDATLGIPWQEGYGAFTVSASNLDRVRHYVRNQETHHHLATFQDEYRLLLERHGVAFDERYLW
jgi:putative transposase